MGIIRTTNDNEKEQVYNQIQNYKDPNHSIPVASKTSFNAKIMGNDTG